MNTPTSSAQGIKSDTSSTSFGKVKICIHDLRSARSDVRAMRTARTLVENGFAVSIIDIESKSLAAQREDTLYGIHIRHVTMPLSFLSTRFERWAFVKATLLFLRSIHYLLQTSADIYHACEVTALPACYIAARIRHKPVVFEAYELPLFDRPVFELSRTRRFIRWLLGFFLSHALPRCAGVIAVSFPIVQEIQNSYHISNVVLLRNLPMYQVVSKSDCLRQLLQLSPNTCIALYQGYLQPDRGLDRLIRAATFLEPNIIIVMMGQGIGTTQQELESLITKEDVADRVKIIPPVPYEELLNWTASADIGLTIIPLDYTLNMRMCLPNKFFEYLMAGLPVLSSPLEAISEIIHSNNVGRVVPSMKPEDVGGAINEMVKDSSALARMRQNALEISSKELCWDKESAKLLELYKHINDTYKISASKRRCNR